MFKPVLAASALLLMGLPALAAPDAPAAKPAAKPARVKAAPLICPVTGEAITSVKDAVGSSVYQGKTYYFCCPSCKPLFDKDPQKYARPAAPATSTPKS